MNALMSHVPLGDVVEVIGGGTPSKRIAEFFGGGIRWATVRDMNSDLLATTEHTITSEGLLNSSSKMIPAGEVVIATRVGLGKVCILERDTAINQDLRGLIPRKGSQIDRRYLFYWLKSIANEIVAAGTGATVQGVKLPFIKGLPFPLVPMEKQRRIVAVLDAAFEGLARARANAEANLRNTRELFRRRAESLFQELSVGSEMVTCRVEDLAANERGSIRTGPFGSQLLHSEFVDEGIAVLGIDNAVANEFRWGKRRFISEAKYQELSRYTVHPGDVIITIMGTCGRCAIIPDDIPPAINTKHLCCITLDQTRCLPDFLQSYFLHSPKARSYLEAEASGSVMDGLNMGIIKALPVDLPGLQRQQELVDHLGQLRGATAELESHNIAKIAACDELRQSLLHKAFVDELMGQQHV